MRITGDHLDQVLHPQLASKDLKVIATGLAASPGAAVGRVVLHRGRRRRRGRARREGHPRAPGDVARGRARHERERGHPHVAGRAREPCRGRGPRMGHPRGRRRRGARASTATTFTVGDVVVREGDVISLDGSTGQVILGEAALSASEPPRRVRHRARLGRQDPQGQARRAGERRQRARRRERPPVRCRGHRPVPHRAHVPRRGPAAGRAADDPRPDPEEEADALEAAAGRAEGRLHRDPRGDGRPARHRAPARPAAARVPAPSRRARDQAGDGRAHARGAEPSGRGAVVARVQPDARHPRRAPRRA